jgi:hypothetical protein
MNMLRKIVDLLRSDPAIIVEQLIAVLAIAMAIVHERALKRQLDHIRQLREALPTRHLGEFPKYLDQIVLLIRRAHNRVVICCDFPAYGSFSDPKEFFNYRQELERKSREGIPITIACLDGPQRQISTREQFEMAPKAWEKWKDAHRHKIEQYLEIHSPTTQTADLTLDGFVALISAEDTRVLDVTFESATRVPLDKKPPVFFWLIDESMVFAIPGAHRLMEHGFLTQDSNFIEGLCDIVERYTPLVIATVARD